MSLGVVQFNVVQRDVGAFEWTTARSSSCIAIDGAKHGIIAEERVCSALRASGMDSYAEASFNEVATGKLLINLINAPSKQGSHLLPNC